MSLLGPASSGPLTLYPLKEALFTALIGQSRGYKCKGLLFPSPLENTHMFLTADLSQQLALLDTPATEIRSYPPPLYATVDALTAYQIWRRFVHDELSCHKGFDSFFPRKNTILGWPKIKGNDSVSHTTKAHILLCGNPPWTFEH